MIGEEGQTVGPLLMNPLLIAVVVVVAGMVAVAGGRADERKRDEVTRYICCRCWSLVSFSIVILPI